MPERRDGQTTLAFINPALKEVLMLPVKGFAKHLLIYLPTDGGIDLIRVYHAARDLDGIDPARQGKGAGSPRL
jgi:hypothetical protein